MVGQEGDGYRLVHAGNSLDERFQHAVVEILDRAELQRHIAFVACLVAGLDMQIYKIVCI